MVARSMLTRSVDMSENGKSRSWWRLPQLECQAVGDLPQVLGDHQLRLAYTKLMEMSYASVNGLISVIFSTRRASRATRTCRKTCRNRVRSLTLSQSEHIRGHSEYLSPLPSFAFGGEGLVQSPHCSYPSAESIVYASCRRGFLSRRSHPSTRDQTSANNQVDLVVYKATFYLTSALSDFASSTTDK